MALHTLYTLPPQKNILSNFFNPKGINHISKIKNYKI